eukprot:TRINITY_DN12343_c0_g1_i1.p1 TRINITY_DN12343_c0_g1~~TRINITY_DN12343_c0_g1_i1.p1  ORF type:complete len:532 (-),score=111.20 TRINITY_DN12343_c0_g1_i1:61-1656(-)
MFRCLQRWSLTNLTKLSSCSRCHQSRYAYQHQTIARAGPSASSALTYNFRSEYADSDFSEASSFGAGALALTLLLPGALWWFAFRQTDYPLPMPKAFEAAGVVVHPDLRIRKDRQKGSGLFIRKPVDADVVLLRVPRSVVLSGSVAQQVLGCPDLAPEVALCALLAEGRRNAESSSQEDALGLREYLLALPRDFSSLPLTYDEEEADKQLRGTALPVALAALRARCEEEQHEAVTKLGEQLQAVWSQKHWRWAKAAIMTRAGVCQIQDPNSPSEEPDIGVVPLVDFVNCSASPTAKCRVAADGAIELVAVVDISAGSEVTISYGKQSQEQQLFTFGFILTESSLEVMTPLAMIAPPSAEDVGEPTQGNPYTKDLKSALLRLLFLERQDDLEATNVDSTDGLSTSLPPLARLRATKASDGSLKVDVSELYATANLLQSSDSELQKVLSHVKETGVLPKKLREEASVAALQMLRNLMQDWQLELTAEQTKSKESRYDAAHIFRKSSADLVEAALVKIREEEELAAALSGSALS